MHPPKTPDLGDRYDLRALRPHRAGGTSDDKTTAQEPHASTCRYCMIIIIGAIQPKKSAAAPTLRMLSSSVPTVHNH